MSYWSELCIEIQEEIQRGQLCFADIAKKYNVDIEDVEDINAEMIEYEMDCDDSDDGYALASAGFGTDEDYGCYDEF